MNALDMSYFKVEDAIATVIFAHGAGAGKDHEFISTMVDKLNQRQLSVITFNFPYMTKRAEDGKRRPPDRMPKLIEHYQAVLAEVVAEAKEVEVMFLAGKSMGFRVATMLAGEALPNLVKGVLGIGYPFHPQKKPENLRLEPLQNTQLPIKVLQGTRDALGNQEEISNYELSELVEISYLDDGDHDIKPRVKSGFTHQQHMESAADIIEEFVKAHV